MKWCELKFARSNYARRKNIVLVVQDMLEQVRKFKLGGLDQVTQPHESVYEPDVLRNGGKLHIDLLKKESLLNPFSHHSLKIYIISS